MRTQQKQNKIWKLNGNVSIVQRFKGLKSTLEKINALSWSAKYVASRHSQKCIFYSTNKPSMRNCNLFVTNAHFKQLAIAVLISI